MSPVGLFGWMVRSAYLGAPLALALQFTTAHT
jgi:hypothetical protein